MLPRMSLSVQNPETYDIVLCEWRLMFGTMLACCSALLLFIVATATDHWVIATIEGTVVQLSDETHAENLSTLLHVGIWREHRLRRYGNGTETEEWIPHFPVPPDRVRRLRGYTLPHYYRSQAVFSAIAVVLMSVGIVCAVYSFHHYRYMYKRLTAGLQMLAAMCILVVLEVTVHHLNEWRLDLMSVPRNGPQLDPPVDPLVSPDQELTVTLTQKDYGYSTYLAWYTFGVHCVAPVIFIIGSRKRKGAKAATEEFEYEDRTIVISR